MVDSLDRISQISIHLKDEQERINEVALFHPLARTSTFDEESKPVRQRKWHYLYQLPWLRRMQLKIQSFLFKRLPFLIPSERVTAEAKFKTVLALLLAQEQLREFFLAHEKRRENFLQALQRVASACGYEGFSLPSYDDPLLISRQLTRLSGYDLSLIDDLVTLNGQKAALSHEERDALLWAILNQVERPPITSILEVVCGDRTEAISLTTQYATYTLATIEPHSGTIDYLYTKDQALSSIQTKRQLAQTDSVPNQRYATDSKTGYVIGSYSGALDTRTKLLEQIFLILDVQQEALLLTEGPYTEEKTILFTSLFSWNEMNAIGAQHYAIQSLNYKVLKIGDNRAVLLHLLHVNIPLNVSTHYPTPGEIGAAIQDINDEAMIRIIGELWGYLGLFSAPLTTLNQKYQAVLKEKNLFKRHQQILLLVDAFREQKPALIQQLEDYAGRPPCQQAGIALLKGKKRSGRRLQGMDQLLYLNVVATHLHYAHNKNCQNSTDRSAGANAADKAQYVYQTVYGKVFLPDEASDKELALFKVLYSMYLVWEEPEITAALSTGFIGEKFYHNFLQKNPETTQYLMPGLKKHPEMYLGLSDQRT